MPKPPDYGILYNWDGAPHGYSEVPQTLAQFLEKMYAPIEDTQVGAHFWCIGEQTACYQDRVVESIGEMPDRIYGSAANHIFDENVRGMIERGEDAQAEAIRRGRELGLHVYVSVRMNDNHFGGAQPEDMAKMPHHKAITRMHREHPEWTLGDRAQEDCLRCRGTWRCRRCGCIATGTWKSCAGAGIGTASNWIGSGTASTWTRSTATD